MWTNALSLAGNPRLLRSYLKFKLPGLVGRSPKARLPFGAWVSTRTFTEFANLDYVMPSEAEVNLLRHCAAQPGAVLFDVGANVGIWSTMMAKHNPAARIYAFEPAPFTFEMLVQNVEANGASNVTCENSAAAEVEGRLRFEEPPNAFLLSRLAPRGEGAPACERFASAKVVEVQGVVLDSYCAAHGVEHIHFMKIDVEGAEPLVLRGLSRMLRERRVDRILIEAEAVNLEAMGASTTQLCAVVESVGYALFKLDKDGQPGKSMAAAELTGNVLCMPRSA